MKYLSQPQFTHSIQIKKSDFVTTLVYVQSAEEAEFEISKMKSAYPNATHHCSAYVIHSPTLIKKAYDDGEPSKTAGIPILRSIEYSGFVNILVIVTRYFGGVKLGAGGLIRAYGQAAKEALLLAPYQVPKHYYEIELHGEIQYFGSLSNSIYTSFPTVKLHSTFKDDTFSLHCTVDIDAFEQFQSFITNQFHFIQFDIIHSYFK